MANQTVGTPKAAAEKTTRTTSKDVESDVAQLRADVAALTETLKSYGTDTAKKLQGRAYDKKDEMSDQFRIKEEELKAQVREKPLQALGIAAGVGFLIGVIWRS